MARLLHILIMTSLLSGCTHHQLRFSAVNQAGIVADIHTQQVLDNLAKFAHNANSHAHYSFPQTGSTQVTDSASSTPSFTFSPFRLGSWSLPINGGRNNQEAYTSVPINNPRKLELMRCAYRIAILGNFNSSDGTCLDCDARLNEFYFGTPTPGMTAKRTAEGYPISKVVETAPNKDFLVYAMPNEDNKKIYYKLASGVVYDSSLQENKKKAIVAQYERDSIALLTSRTGKITTACINSGWFCIGTKKDAPKSHCCFKSNYCGTYIWVPSTGVDQLTKLTSVILDFAVNDSAVLPAVKTKEVVSYYDTNGKLTSNGTGYASKETKNVPVDEPALSSKEDTTLESFMKGNLPGQPIDGSHQSESLINPYNPPTQTPGAWLMNENLMLKTLTPQQ